MVNPLKAATPKPKEAAPEPPLPVMRSHCGKRFPSNYGYCPNCGEPQKSLISE